MQLATMNETRSFPFLGLQEPRAALRSMGDGGALLCLSFLYLQLCMVGDLLLKVKADGPTALSTLKTSLTMLYLNLNRMNYNNNNAPAATARNAKTVEETRTIVALA